jgi:NNP family nitrate/nitrite transporter-like MFS transporter
MSMDPSPRSAEAPAQATTVEAPHRGERDQANTMLVLATVGFMVNFWAWALISPLGAAYRDDLGLSAFEQALVVAVPVLVGSLGRIPVGAFTDKLGARVMFPAVSFATVVPVLFLAAFDDSLAALLIGGFFLGIGGTAFAVGIPFVNAWFPPARRGLALGLFGVGMGGTAISAFTTVRLADEFGRATPFVIVACVLTAYGIVAMLLLRDAPGRVPPTGGFWSRTMATLRMRATLQLAWLYAVGFGGFVAFSVYLPTYLKNAYDLTPSDAANRTAGFVILAVAMRPVGGWLSDRIHPVPVLLRRRDRPRDSRRLRAHPHPLGHDRVPRSGGSAGCGVRRGVRPRRPAGATGEGRLRDRRGRGRRRARRLHPAAGHGRHLRPVRRLQPGLRAARPRRPRQRGLHRDRRAPRDPLTPPPPPPKPPPKHPQK